MTKKIFCVGGANIDHKFRALDTIEAGTSNPVSSTKTFGGVARNVAENLSAWTSGIHFQTIIGNDSDGEHILLHLQQLGVNIDGCLKLNNHTTSHYYAVLHHNGELHAAYADMNIYDHVPVDVFINQYCNWTRDSIVFMDTNLPVEIIEYIIKQIHTRNIMVCIDPVSISKAKKIPADLSDVFLIKPNLSEASALTGIAIQSIPDCLLAGRILRDRGVKNVVISMGQNGYVIVNKDRQEHFPVRQIDNIIDVNGSGDAFFAGILFGIQQKSTIMQACKIGAAAAAITLQSDKTVAATITASDLLHRATTLDIASAETTQEKHYAAVF